jgi:hypothetical protein
MGWMLDSNLFQDILADKTRRDILIILEAHIGSVPEHEASQLRAVLDLEKLEELIVPAATCPDLQAFAALLPEEIDHPFVVAAPKSE